MKKIISLFMAFVMLLSVTAGLNLTAYAENPIFGECGKNVNWKYDVATKTLTISGLGAMNDYNKNYKTTPWYGYRENILTVKIEPGVTTIGSAAFSHCNSLKSVTIGNSVKTIGENAFNSCDSLTSVTIPNSVTTIGKSIFYYCRSLTSVTIGNSVTTIGDYAFDICVGLTSITIPNSVKSIGDGAFSGCRGLTNITIPNSVTSIGYDAFANCESLTNITIPNSVTSIGNDAFIRCNSLTNISVVSDSLYYSSENGVLFNKYKSKLIQYPIGNQRKEYTIPNSVISIGRSAFECCNRLTSLTIPNSVTSIGNGAFSSCDGLTNITIPNSVKSIEDNAFSNCDGLTNITIPNSVSSIGYGAFYSCDSLTNIEVASGNLNYSSKDGVLFDKNKSNLIQYPSGNQRTEYTIPNSVKSIGYGAFRVCRKLTSITIPNNVTSIGKYAFTECRKLTSITIPNNVTSIGKYAFMDCRSLTSVTIGNSVKIIDDYAFVRCSRLTSVTIGNSVTTIGKSAFYNCDSLEDVYYLGSEAQWKKISIDKNNEPLTNATIHYNSSLPEQPDDNTSQDISANFKTGRDNNSYVHSRSSGFLGTKNYKIDKSYYNRLVNKSSISEKNNIKKEMNSKWDGSCYGIATTIGMVYENIIPLSSITSKSNVKDYYHLPNPCKDKTLLNSIQYFQLSQNLKKGGEYDSCTSLTVKHNSLKNKKYNYDNLSTFLKKLVKQASNGRTTLFAFANKSYGHTVLIIGCKYDSKNKRYIVKLYDENSVDDDYKGNFDKLIISSDYKKFSWPNEDLNNKTYLEMDFIECSRMKQLDGSVKASRQAKEMTNLNQTDLKFSLDNSFEIVNSSGESLKYDGEDFSGDMNVYSFNVDSNGINSSCNATLSIDSSDYYTVYSPTGNVDFQLSDDTNFVSLSAESASNIEVSLENGIEFNGNNSPFIAYMNTDELVAENETNLISVSGVVNGKTFITESNNVVKATNENGIKNAEISNYVETDENTVKYDKNKVIIDSSDLSDKNTGGSTGGGGTSSSPVPNGTDKKDDDKKPETKPNQSQNTSTSATQKLSVKKLVSKKKALVVYWNKIANVSGYQIQVATDKKFKKNKKTVTVAKQNAIKKTVKKLKAKKKYFVRVRAYKIVDGKKSYGKWSKIKSVKTK